MTRYTRKFFVIFDKQRVKRWWAVFLNKEYYHCFAVTPVTDKSCVVIDSSMGGIKIEAYSEAVEDVVLSYHKNGCTTVLEIYARDIKTPRLKFFRSCVGIVKDMLGIKKLSIITTWQLYKYLKGEQHV